MRSISSFMFWSKAGKNSLLRNSAEGGGEERRSREREEIEEIEETGREDKSTEDPISVFICVYSSIHIHTHTHTHTHTK